MQTIQNWVQMFQILGRLYIYIEYEPLQNLNITDILNFNNVVHYICDWFFIN